jgi:hypothetical protein
VQAYSIIRTVIFLMMETASTSEMLVIFYQTVLCNNPKDSHLQKWEDQTSEVFEFEGVTVFKCMREKCSNCIGWVRRNWKSKNWKFFKVEEVTVLYIYMCVCGCEVFRGTGFHLSAFDISGIDAYIIHQLYL